MAQRHDITHATDVGEEAVHGASASLEMFRSAALKGDPVDLFFEGACSLITEELNADRVEIVGPSRREGTFKVVACRGWGADHKDQMLDLPIGEILAWVYTSEAPVLVSDTDTDRRFNLRQTARAENVRSVVAVPIPGRLTPYGVIAAYSTVPGAFEMPALGFLAWTAELVGSAVESSHRLSTLEATAAREQRRAEMQQAIARCARALLSSSGERRLVEALDVLLQASDADYVYARRNTVTPTGELVARTVASAFAGSVPEELHDDPYWDEVAWSRMPTAHAHLSAGLDFVVVPERLEGGEGVLYLQSPIPIRSQLDIPVFVNGEWAGVIGFADGSNLLEWSGHDLALLRAAGDMVGAFWERAEARSALEAVLASKNEFLATVSHELRTPLTSVLGMADEMRNRFEELSVDERAESLDMIFAESLDMSHLIEDLLTAARVDAGRLTVSHRTIDLRKEVDRILHELPAVSGTPVEGEAVAWGDDFRVRQIIRNLLTNAVRYGGDELRITITRFGAQSVITVADNGDGIAPADTERLFNAFERGPHLIGNPQPIGLGLAVSRELARLMLGDLTYEHIDGWCTFTLALPHTEADAEAVDVPESFPSGG